MSIKASTRHRRAYWPLLSSATCPTPKKRQHLPRPPAAASRTRLRVPNPRRPNSGCITFPVRIANPKIYLMTDQPKIWATAVPSPCSPFPAFFPPASQVARGDSPRSRAISNSETSIFTSYRARKRCRTLGSIHLWEVVWLKRTADTSQENR